MLKEPDLAKFEEAKTQALLKLVNEQASVVFGPPTFDLADVAEN